MSRNIDMHLTEVRLASNKAHVWSAISVLTSLTIALTAVVVLALSIVSPAGMTADVAETLSGEALAIGLCTLATLLNAYATYQLSHMVRD